MKKTKTGMTTTTRASPRKSERRARVVMFASGLHTLFGNIAAVLTKLGRFEEAVAAADHAIFLNPEWAKGYFRKGAALFALEKSHEAVVAYDAGLKVEPDNKDLKQGRELAAKNAANDEAKAKEASKDSKPERETKDTVAGGTFGVGKVRERARRLLRRRRSLAGRGCTRSGKEKKKKRSNKSSRMRKS